MFVLIAAGEDGEKWVIFYIFVSHKFTIYYINLTHLLNKILMYLPFFTFLLLTNSQFNILI